MLCLRGLSPFRRRASMPPSAQREACMRCMRSANPRMRTFRGIALQVKHLSRLRFSFLQLKIQSNAVHYTLHTTRNDAGGPIEADCPQGRFFRSAALGLCRFFKCTEQAVK